VSLAASATVQVPQDELTLTLSTQREGVNAQEVQSQLKSALDAALTLAKRQAQSPLMSVSTGRFGLSPRHDRNGKLVGCRVRPNWCCKGVILCASARRRGSCKP